MAAVFPHKTLAVAGNGESFPLNARFPGGRRSGTRVPLPGAVRPAEAGTTVRRPLFAKLGMERRTQAAVDFEDKSPAF